MQLNAFLPAAATVVLLGGLALQKSTYPKQGDADEYHKVVKSAVESIPYEFEGWVGTDDNVPRTAIALLRPNVILSRKYVNERTQQQVSFLIVQCRDARDMIGHYPPVCYPANGWTERHANNIELELGDVRLDGTSYEFYKAYPTLSKTMYVANVIFLPDGNMPRDMNAVRSLAADYRKHFFGAAQVQMTFGGRMSSDQRHKILKTFLGTNVDVFQKIRSGVQL